MTAGDGRPVRAAFALKVGRVALVATGALAAGATAVLYPAPKPSSGDVANAGPGAPGAPTALTADRSAPDALPASSSEPSWEGSLESPAVRIALQVGHWRAAEAPPELAGIRSNGALWQGIHEWEFNMAIAREAAVLLRAEGYVVELLPATVQPGYRADLFIAIHADASADLSVEGFRVAAPRRDATRQAATFARVLSEHYGEATGVRQFPTVTRRMRNYYAFNHRRYRHALHPMTPAVIIETGFLTNAGDREIIVKQPELAARGIANAVMAYPPTPPPNQREQRVAPE
ncbi:MAG: N-acetylmuramoyl-L-alanine amidase [Gemmatimonadetes bacterium]|nr:N-acetylmuramoyl-L-alanine amidase [Gemmatimonadota bacterium]